MEYQLCVKGNIRFSVKIPSRAPWRRPKCFYIFLILIATTKAGTDSKKRMFQKPAVEDAGAIIEYPPPLPLPPPYCLEGAKLAEHVLLSFMFISHVGFLPQAEQSPPHPTKV